jgi:hypothetical protein
MSRSSQPPPPPSPDDPLAPAEAALARGDHAEARRLAQALTTHADPAVRARAEALLARLRPDPVIVAVLVGTALLIAVLSALYLGTR